VRSGGNRQPVGRGQFQPIGITHLWPAKAPGETGHVLRQFRQFDIVAIDQLRGRNTGLRLPIQRLGPPIADQDLLRGRHPQIAFGAAAKGIAQDLDDQGAFGKHDGVQPGQRARAMPRDHLVAGVKMLDRQRAIEGQHGGSGGDGDGRGCAHVIHPQPGCGGGRMYHIETCSVMGALRTLLFVQRP